MPEDDDLKPRPKPVLPLDALSVGELETRVAELKAEIARCEEMIASKKGHLDAAASLFRTKQP